MRDRKVLLFYRQNRREPRRAVHGNKNKISKRKNKNRMAKLNDIFGGDYLKAEHLGDRPVTVTIESVKVKDFDDGSKLILTFSGKDKALVCNRTNANTIADMLGSSDTDDWEGKRIILIVRKVDFQGKRVPAIRVMDELPKSAQAAQAQRKVEPEPEPEGDPDEAQDIPF